MDQFEKPKKILNSTWVFKTKPATASLPEKAKARSASKNFYKLTAKISLGLLPMGKFPSLLPLLVLAIDFKLPI